MLAATFLKLSASRILDLADEAKYWARNGIDQARQGAALKGMKSPHRKFNNFGDKP